MAPRTAGRHPCLSMSRPANRWAALGFITLAVMTSVIAINLFCLVMASLVRNRIAKDA